MVDRLLDAVRGAFPDMADIVASTLRLQFGAVLLDTLADAQRFQFLALAADDQDGPESAAMHAVPSEEMDRIESSGAAPSSIMRAGLDRAMEIYGAPVPDVDAGRRVWLDKLDFALNGAAGATGASLVDLVEQVERQQRAVHIVNFDDGMVINFRAPDARRATLNLSELLDEAARMERGGQVWPIMRDAVADYPSVGPRVPVRETVADAAEKRAAGIKPDDARNLGVQRAPASIPAWRPFSMANNALSPVYRYDVVIGAGIAYDQAYHDVDWSQVTQWRYAAPDPHEVEP